VKLYTRTNPTHSTANAERVKLAQGQRDSSMILTTLRSSATDRVTPAAPAVPSTIVLSDDGPVMVKDAEAARLESVGWQVRRMRGIHHDMMLKDAPRTFAAISDLL
jgi:hypothetical protein